MSKVNKIVYDPSLSIEENAERNGCKKHQIRYYIRSRGINRRYDERLKIIEDIKIYLQGHPEATKEQVAKETKHGINQVRSYWQIAKGNASPEQFRNCRNKIAKTGLDKELENPSKVANGKPLASDLLKEAGEIIQFAEDADVSRFRNWLLTDRKRPLITIGNGGKHTTYPALLYQMMASIGKAATPLEFATMSPEAIKNSKVLILSNGGANIDIKYATKRAAKYNREHTACFTFTDDDENIMVKTFGLDQSFVFKNHFYDGFVSIRSKILTYVLLYKAFSGDTSFADKIRSEGKYTVEINKRGAFPRWNNINHFNILYGSYGEPVAHDIESTMVEGGIASVQLTDYRNYCHGRFIFSGNHCSSKKIKKTDVCTILLITPREEKIAKTIREKVLPDNMPVVEIRTDQDNPLATIQLLIDALTFTFDVAEKGFHINPNSPHNYASIDKRFPKNGVNFAQELTRLGELHYDDTVEPIESETAPKEPSETKPVEVVEKKPTKKKQTKEAKADKKPKKINTTIRCTDTHVYFYQNTPLSNWWVSEPAIPYDNRTFTSSEALFMYLKAKVFRDDYMADVIAPTHYDVAKELGRLVRNFDKKIWERERENAMYIALKAKLKVDNVYRETLLSDEYRGKTFVEASPSDDEWGIHLSIEDAYNGEKWQGLNLLGKLHTIIRDELLGLREPQQRDITPITDEEFAKIQRDSEEKANKRAKMPPSKNKYSTDGSLVRSVIGGIVGDIAGSSREGYRKSQSQVREILTQSSYFTDDTTMIVAVADWLNHKDEISLKDCMIKWYNRFPNVGFGKLFQAFAETGEAQPSNANGGAMRVAPLAVTANTLDEALALAEEQCLVSHTTDIAINGTKAIAAAVFLAKEGVAVGKSVAEIKDTIKSYIEEKFGYDLNMSLKDIQARSTRLSFLKALYNIAGIASEEYENNNLSSASLSCPMAIMAFLYGENYEASIRYALAMGGDADTIACMAGCISAQVYGIPQQIVDEALLYLPPEMIDVLNEFEKENTFEPTGTTPPKIEKWSVKNDVVVYGIGDKVNESGKYDTLYSRDNRYPKKGYTIPTIGKSIEEIQESVNVFIEHAKNNSDMRFHVRKVGYDKAGYTVEQIAPLFREARTVRNILLPKAIVDMLNS